jgi:hypothetical protein
MTRMQSDRNFSAYAPKRADGRERFAELFDQTEIVEVFDEAIRLRFGKLINRGHA